MVLDLGLLTSVVICVRIIMSMVLFWDAVTIFGSLIDDCCFSPWNGGDFVYKVIFCYDPELFGVGYVEGLAEFCRRSLVGAVEFLRKSEVYRGALPEVSAERVEVSFTTLSDGDWVADFAVTLVLPYSLGIDRLGSAVCRAFTAGRWNGLTWANVLSDSGASMAIRCGPEFMDFRRGDYGVYRLYSRV